MENILTTLLGIAGLIIAALLSIAVPILSVWVIVSIIQDVREIRRLKK